MESIHALRITCRVQRAVCMLLHALHCNALHCSQGSPGWCRLGESIRERIGVIASRALKERRALEVLLMIATTNGMHYCTTNGIHYYTVLVLST